MATARSSKWLINATADSTSTLILPSPTNHWSWYPRQGEIPCKGLLLLIIIIIIMIIITTTTTTTTTTTLQMLEHFRTEAGVVLALVPQNRRLENVSVGHVAAPSVRPAPPGKVFRRKVFHCLPDTESLERGVRPRNAAP
jgi:hypothetical protein